MAKLPSIANRFDKSIQNSQQDHLIAQLQSEVERLRTAQSPEIESELEKLRAQLMQQSGEHDVRIDLIDPNPSQPRQTIPQDSIVKLARSLEKDGQITPVIVIPIGERYLLWDGQRRWEASKYLGRATIRAVFAPMPEDLHRKSLLTFIHHEDLNPLDKAEAIVQEIARASQIQDHEIPKILSTALRRLDRQKLTTKVSALVSAIADEQKQGLAQMNLDRSEFQVLEVLLDLNLNPSSVKANLVSILALPKDLKESIRNDGLKAAHALALAALTGKNLEIDERKATKARVNATERVIRDELSVKETRQLVTQIRAQNLTDNASESKQVKTVIRSLERLNNPALLRVANSDQLGAIEDLLMEMLADVRRRQKTP